MIMPVFLKTGRDGREGKGGQECYYFRVWLEDVTDQCRIALFCYQAPPG